MHLTGLNGVMLRRLYAEMGRTDTEIADFFGVDRTSIVHMRKRHHVTSRKTVGEIGEELVIKELLDRGYFVEDMNEVDKLHIYDLLVNKIMRIEVKTATLGKSNRFVFSLSEKKGNDNVESDTRIRLGNGRTRKLYRKTCDLMVFVGLLNNGENYFFLVDPKSIPDSLGVMNVPANPKSKSKHKLEMGNWGLLEEKLRELGDVKEDKQ